MWTRKAAKAAAEERTLDALVIVASTSPLLLLSSLPLVCARLRADTKIEAERIRTAGRMILCLLRRATPKVYFREFDKPVTYATFLSELDQAYEDVMLVMIADRNLPISDETTDLLERSLQRLSDRIGRFAERSNIKVFDVYEGERLEDGKKSIAISITLQPVEATLTDEEIDAVADKVTAEPQVGVSPWVQFSKAKLSRLHHHQFRQSNQGH